MDSITLVQDNPLRFDSLETVEKFLESDGCELYGDVDRVDVRWVHGEVFIEGDTDWKELEHVLEIAKFKRK